MARLTFDRFLAGPTEASRDGTDRRLRCVEDAVRRLPPLPAMMTELLRELAQADADIGALEQYILRDPTLAPRLLRMANSAFYSPRATVENVGHALMLLGLQSSRNLVVATAVRAVMRSSWFVPGFRPDGIFAHSVAVGVCCARLGRGLDALAEHTDQLFLAGLLHDVGMIAAAEQYGGHRSAFDDHGGVHPASERAVLGFDHQDVGRLVWAHWKLPEELAPVITRHHEDPEELAAHPLAIAVVLADAHADLCGQGLVEPGGDEAVRARCARLLGADEAEALDLLDGFEEEMEALVGSIR